MLQRKSSRLALRLLIPIPSPNYHYCARLDIIQNKQLRNLER